MVIKAKIQIPKKPNKRQIRTHLVNLARKSVATGSASELIPTNSSTMYIYIKAVSGENATDFLQVKVGSHAVMRLNVGEFLFVPVYNGYAINTESYGGAIVTEYGYWTKG